MWKAVRSRCSQVAQWSWWYIHFDLLQIGDLFVGLFAINFLRLRRLQPEGVQHGTARGRSPHCEIACRAMASLGFGASGTVMSMGETLICSKWILQTWYQPVGWDKDSKICGKSALEESWSPLKEMTSFFPRRVIWQGVGIPGHLAKVVDGVRFLVHLHRHKFEAACSLCWIQQRRPGSAMNKMSAPTSTLWYSSILAF